MFHFKRSLLVILLITFCSVQAQDESEPGLCKKRKLEKWEELANKGKYKDAIDELVNYININPKKNKHRDYWHLGQLYAFDDNYHKALKYFRKSTNIFDKLADREWKLYYKGTIAFLKRDKDKLKRTIDKLLKMHSLYYKENANRLKALYDNFEKTYLEAYTKN